MAALQSAMVRILPLLALMTFAGPPNPDYTGLKRGNRWTFANGTTVVIDQVDSISEGWKYRRVSLEKCPYCKDKLPVADTSWALVRGDSVFQAGPETGGKWELSMILPPKVGAKWLTDSLENVTLEWVAKSSITVAAGRFTDCWRVHGSDSLDLWTERKAGLVKLKQGDLNVELQSFQPGE